MTEKKIRESITIDDALEVLNRAFDADPLAIDALRSAQVPCNEHLADDPEIQVRAVHRSDDEYATNHHRYMVGFLGIINGLFGGTATGAGAIVMVYGIDCPSGCELAGFDVKVGDVCPLCETERLMLGQCQGFKRGSEFKESDEMNKHGEGAPKYVDKFFRCNGNQLTSLKGAPLKIGGNFFCDNNPHSAWKDVRREDYAKV